MARTGRARSSPGWPDRAMRAPTAAAEPGSSPRTSGGHRQKEWVDMPFIQVKVIENVFSSEQKGQIVRELTDAMVRVEGEAMRPVTWCVIEEVRSGDWAI